MLGAISGISGKSVIDIAEASCDTINCVNDYNKSRDRRTAR